MLNAEKYKKEIKKILKSDIGSLIAIKNNKPIECSDILCSECDFTINARKNGKKFDRKSCRCKLFEWMMYEYKETPVLTKRQHALCIALATGYLVRNRNNNLMWFNFLPKWSEIKEDYVRDKEDGMIPMFINDNIGYFPKFDFIKKGDKPYSIVEMLNWEIEK